MWMHKATEASTGAWLCQVLLCGHDVADLKVIELEAKIWISPFMTRQSTIDNPKDSFSSQDRASRDIKFWRNYLLMCLLPDSDLMSELSLKSYLTSAYLRR